MWFYNKRTFFTAPLDLVSLIGYLFIILIIFYLAYLSINDVRLSLFYIASIIFLIIIVFFNSLHFIFGSISISKKGKVVVGNTYLRENNVYFVNKRKRQYCFTANNIKKITLLNYIDAKKLIKSRGFMKKSLEGKKETLLLEFSNPIVWWRNQPVTVKDVMSKNPGKTIVYPPLERIAFSLKKPQKFVEEIKKFI